MCPLCPPLDPPLYCNTRTFFNSIVLFKDFYKFWPDEEAQYGNIKVTQKSKSERNSYNGYKFTILGESVVSRHVIFYPSLLSLDCYHSY